MPGFVQIDCVGHEGGEPSGDFCQTLTVTDIHAGWTETRSVKNKAQKWAFEALVAITEQFPFKVKGIDSDNGNEFINAHLVHRCEQEKLTFTRYRAGNKNDGAYVEQKNRHIVCPTVGYHRSETAEELDLLNQLYLLPRLQTHFFFPCQS